MAPINTVECENSLPPGHLGLVSRPVPATSKQKRATILCHTRPALQPIQEARNKSKWIVHLHAAHAKRIPSKSGIRLAKAVVCQGLTGLCAIVIESIIMYVSRAEF